MRDENSMKSYQIIVIVFFLLSLIVISIIGHYLISDLFTIKEVVRYSVIFSIFYYLYFYYGYPDFTFKWSEALIVFASWLFIWFNVSSKNFVIFGISVFTILIVYMFVRFLNIFVARDKKKYKEKAGNIFFVLVVSISLFNLWGTF